MASVCAELDRRQDWRASGGDLVRRRGWSSSSGSLTPRPGPTRQVAEHVSDLPHLAAGLSEGRLNLDKVRAVLGVATPESEARWAEAAASCSL